MALSCAGAQASFISDVWGIANDPLKLGAGSANMLQSVIRIQQIINDLGPVEAKANSDIQARLADVKDIVSQAMAAIDRGEVVAQNLILQIEMLAEEIESRAEKLIESTKCAVVVASDELNQALKEAALTLKKAKPGLSIFGFRVIELETNEVEIRDPWEAFQGVVDVHLTAIRGFKPETPAKEFLHRYGEIVRLARKAQCHYKGDPSAWYIERNFVLKFTSLAAAWVAVVNPQ